MSAVAAVVLMSGHAVVQDLGRPGFAHVGITANGAADQHAARVANILIGNADTAPVIEITGSAFEVSAVRPLLVAVTGAADGVIVDGHPHRSWSTIAVRAGSTVKVASPSSGLRSYLAVNGAIDAERAFGSVAPDSLYGIGRRLRAGDELRIDTNYDGPPDDDPYTALFDLSAPRISTSARVTVTAGPELSRLTDTAAWLEAGYTVGPRSDSVGLRLSGPRVEQRTTDEILSRGVPVGAVEVTPSGELLVLLRARLLTAGYPVIAVATSEAVDRLGQVGPGDSIRFELTDVGVARARLLEAEVLRDELARRVGRAFVASGLGGVVDAGHRSRAS